MGDADFRKTTGNAKSAVIGLGLLGAAGLVLYFTSGLVFQAFNGPRPITEQELLQITNPRSGDNYVLYTPSRPFVDTELQWGNKNNPGTKYLLLPVGDRLMLCSARIADNGPTFVGRLEARGGNVEEEVVSRVSAVNPVVRQRLTPILFQAVRSIWFDTGVALAAILGLGVGGLQMTFRACIDRRRGATSDDAPLSKPNTLKFFSSR